MSIDKLEERLEKARDLPVAFDTNGNMISFGVWMEMIEKEDRPILFPKLPLEEEKKIVMEIFKQREPFEYHFLSEAHEIDRVLTEDYRIDNARAVEEVEKGSELGMQLIRITEQTLTFLLEKHGIKEKEVRDEVIMRISVRTKDHDVITLTEDMKKYLKGLSEKEIRVHFEIARRKDVHICSSCRGKGYIFHDDRSQTCRTCGGLGSSFKKVVYR